jgi:hypothetical protein
MKRLRGIDQEKEATVTARLDALRKHKEAMDDSLEKRRASVRFEPTAESSTAVEDDLMGDQSGKTFQASDSPREESISTDGPTYTERLLEAKRKARKK